MEYTIKIGDTISFRDANKSYLGHGHEVISFSEAGHPQVMCDGKTLTVTPKQIRYIWDADKENNQNGI